jgi:hypothetical protein
MEVGAELELEVNVDVDERAAVGPSWRKAGATSMSANGMLRAMVLRLHVKFMLFSGNSLHT